jgi:hypothetical protein
VGIGTTNPQQKLDIQGNIHVSGNINNITNTELSFLSGITSSLQTQLNNRQATITGAATSITNDNLTISRALVSDTSGKVSVSAVTSTQIGFLEGVTSSIQTQLNNRQATITGAATSITNDNLTISRALVSDTSGKVSVSAVTNTELGFLSGVTSSIQTQLNSASSQWTTGTGLIFYNSGTVGIGKTNPNTSYKLDITGDAYVVGNVYATSDIVSSFSDIRLKDVISEIQDPIQKVMNIRTFKYTPSHVAKSHGIHNNNVQIGVSAQDVQAVLPEIVTLAPFDTIIENGEKVSKSGENFLTVSYERLVPLLIECIKDLHNRLKTVEEKSNKDLS